jgi:hypothetical protein
MQIAEEPVSVTISPEGNVICSISLAALLWQATQSIGDPVGAGTSTLPAMDPSAPRKSISPGPEWHVAQFSGTAPSAFQCTKDSDFLSPCGEAIQLSTIEVID